MKHLLTLIRIKSTLLSLFILITFGVVTAKAQSYWDKIPALTSECYTEKDDYGKKIQELKSEIKDRLEKSRHATEEKVSKMTNEERMAMATKYQNMKPEEIVKRQNEMMAMTQAQTEFQQSASEVETSFNELESDFRSPYAKRLGAIESEYKKLPDGEGTPQWAIKKGEELMASYNKEYEAICHDYFTSSDAKFKTWLKDFNKFLHEKEIPFNQKMIRMQYAQYGISADESVAELMAIERYLEKCAAIASLRRPYPQG
jgi:hypothetical protein